MGYASASDETWIHLARSQLTRLPTEIFRCYKLQILDLSFNQLTTPPRRLPLGLQTLKLAHNLLCSVDHAQDAGCVRSAVRVVDGVVGSGEPLYADLMWV